MNNKLVLIIYCSALLLLYGCINGPKRDHFDRIDEKTYRRLVQICPKGKGRSLIIYYLDGDCSFCLAKARSIEALIADKPDLAAIFIARTTNKPLFIYHLNQLKIASSYHIETNQEFNKQLGFMKVTRVQPNRVKSDYGKFLSDN